MNDSGYTLWFTGMMGAGKRTLARHVFQRFSLLGKRCEYLSDDDLEPFLPAPLDAPLEVRNRNARVLGWTAELLTRQGVITVVASVSPIREVREEIRRRIGRYAEVFVDCSFDILVERDEARIYERAMEGQIQNVVGVHLPYEPPPHPDVRVDSGEGDVETLAAQVFEGLFELGFLSRTERDILLGRIEPAPVLPAAEGGGGADDGMSNAMDAVGVVEVTAPKKRAPAKKTTKATAKTAAKKTTKATAKAAAKKTTKTTAKTAAKKTTKATAKTAAKKTTKAAAKTAAKKPTKAAAKTAAKKPTKAAAKTAAKKVTKTKANAKTTTKAAAKKAPAKAGAATTRRTRARSAAAAAMG